MVAGTLVVPSFVVVVAVTVLPSFVVVVEAVVAPFHAISTVQAPGKVQ